MSTNLDAVIALEVTLPYGGQVEIGDTLVPSARALNGHGDSVTADIFWVALDTAFITVLDTTTGATRGDSLGTGRLQARVDLLRSNPVPVTVITRLDSAQTIEPTRDTVTISQPDSLSDSLRVQVFATPTIPSQRRVIFTATTFPATGPIVTFVPRDTVLTNSSGVAVTQVKVSLSGPIPDSVVVTATVKRPDGTPISSSGTFVVEFRP